MRENQDLTLTCIVANSKPAAEIKWYRGHVEYKPGKYWQSVFICMSERSIVYSVNEIACIKAMVTMRLKIFTNIIVVSDI